MNLYTRNNYSIYIDPTKDSLLSQAGVSLLKDRYFLPEEKSAQEVFARAACTFASNQDHAQRLYNYMSKLWFTPATPILCNAGTTRGLPISCFGSDVDDSIEGIMDHYEEQGHLASHGGGISASWSSVRSVNETTSRGNISTGLIPFVRVMDSLMLATQQGSNRRGAYAAYLDISHPEILEFIELRTATGGDVNRRCTGTGFHHAVNIPDEFMHAVEQGLKWDLVDPHSKVVKETIDARQLWMKLLIKRLETGEPYIHFITTSNRLMPQHLKDKGLKIKNSNLCVAPETLLLTDKGHEAIGDLENKYVNVWNGEEFSRSFVAKTGLQKNVITVTLSNGIAIDCTPEHTFYVKKNYASAPIPVQAKDLTTGMKLEKAKNFPVIETVTENADARLEYSKGFYSGDGNEDYSFSFIYEPKKQVIPHLIGSVSDKMDTNNRYKWTHGDLAKFDVPTADKTINERLAYLAGYLDADGCVLLSDNCQNIQVCSVNYSHLYKLKLMLQTLGCDVSLTFRREEGEFLLPKNDGSGENGLFTCKEVWLLNLNGVAVQTLCSLGLTRFLNRLSLSEQNPQRSAQKFVSVVSVVDTGRVTDTFCLNEPKKHRVIFNGTLTGNCNEIFLPSAPDRTFVCCLSSVNVEYFSSWCNEDMFIRDIAEMLDNVLTSFIHNAPRTMWRAINSASNERSVGLGAMGFHLFLQSKNVPWESVMAQSWNTLIFKHINTKMTEANLKLGTERGEAPDAKGTGKRFSHQHAIAPNANIAVICGNTSPSVEPFSANAFVQKTLSGSFMMKNKALVKVLETYGFKEGTQECEDVWTFIASNKGSVKGLSFMSEEHKNVFKTALELNQQWIVKLASERQPYICQGQSLNLFFPPTVHKQELHDVHMSAWRQGLKGLYYCRSQKAIEAQQITEINFDTNKEEECISCQG